MFQEYTVQKPDGLQYNCKCVEQTVWSCVLLSLGMQLSWSNRLISANVIILVSVKVLISSFASQKMCEQIHL